MHHYGPNKMPLERLTYDRIPAALPSIFTVVEDAGDRINQLNAVESSREINELKRAHQVVRAGGEAFYRLAEAGIREIDLAMIAVARGLDSEVPGLSWRHAQHVPAYCAR